MSTSSKPTPIASDRKDSCSFTPPRTKDGEGGEELVYTPTSSSVSTSIDEFPTVKSDWSGNRNTLVEQVGSLNKELMELKEMITHGSLSSGQNEGDMAELYRVKANHRSSLASLAESHRTEIAELVSAHDSTIHNLEQTHIDEMRGARRSGYNSDFVKSLHESYAKQIENLVLDLSEAKQEAREYKLKSPTGPLPSQSSNAYLRDDISTRKLTMMVRFDGLDKAFNVAELTIPHPGESFRAVLKHLSHAVRNYLQTLHAATKFFTAGPSGTTEARKIRHWFRSAEEERIHFRFLHGAGGDDMKDLWENGCWKKSGFTLKVACAAQAWDNVPVFTEELVEGRNGSTTASEPLSMTSGELVQVEDSTLEGFNPVAELERINRELGELEIQDQFHQSSDDEDENKENIEYPVPKRKVTVEEIRDEADERSRFYEGEAEDEGVGLAITSPLPVERLPFVPLVWESDVSFSDKNVEINSKATGHGGYLSRLLGNEPPERKQPKHSSSADSWLFDDLFSPLPADKAKGNEKEKGVVLTDEPEQLADNTRKQFLNNKRALNNALHEETALLGNAAESKWRWMLTSDGRVKTPPAPQQVDSDNRVLGLAKHYFNRDSWLDRVRQEEILEDKQTSQSEITAAQEEESKEKDKPFFSFVDDSVPSPAPPVAPEPITRRSPTLPAYLQAEIESSCHGIHLDEDSDIEEVDQQKIARNSENPFADLKPGQCDTPVLGASVLSSTPLLNDDVAARKSEHDATISAIPIDKVKSPHGLTPPPAPFPKTAKTGFSSVNSRQSPPRLGVFRFQNVEEKPEDTQTANDPWESASERSVSTVADWQHGDANGRHKKCGRGKGPEAYTWRRDPQEDSFSNRSVSPPLPPPSRSSTTTTDRNSEFILPPPTYQHNVGNNNGGNIGPIHYGSMRPMGPLGPQHQTPGFQNVHHTDAAFHQQMKQMKELFASNYVRSNGVPPFAGGPVGPVYAPNPPLSLAPFSGGMALSSPPPFLNGPQSVQRMTSDSNLTWGIHGPHNHTPHSHPPHMWNPNDGPRRSYSTDSISPLLWKVDDAIRHSEQQGMLPGPMMPPGPPQPQASGMEQGFPNPWTALGPYGQPSTPGSHVGMHGPQQHSPWYGNQMMQPQVPQVTPYEIGWSPSQMGIPPQWAGANGGF